MNSAIQQLATTKGDLQQDPSLPPWTMEIDDASNISNHDLAESEVKFNPNHDLAESEVKFNPKINPIASPSSSDWEEYDWTKKLSSPESFNNSLNNSHLELIKPNWLLSLINSKPRTPNMSPLSFSGYDSTFDEGPSIHSITSSPEAEKAGKKES